MRNGAAGVLIWVKDNKLMAGIFLVIFFVGVFVRVYEFGDWLHFQLDQSRDCYVVSKAYEEGIGNLPLLGPRAGGSYLRLGPIFYYFEYLSALVFGNTPEGMAAHTAIFAILSIPLFFLFSKMYFRKNISVALTFLYSISFFFIMYSRFAWNPNLLPFFVILTFYSLLKATDEKTEKPFWWFFTCGVSLAITTQLHFLAFMAIPATVVAFLLIRKRKTSWKYWLTAVLIGVFFYIPVIINDVKTGGKSIEQFVYATTKKTGKKKDHNFIELAYRDARENALGFGTILIGNDRLGFTKLKNAEIGDIDFKCEKDCEESQRLALGLVAVTFFCVGLFFLIRNTFKEKDQKRKDFLVLSFLWFAFCFILFFPISYDMSPRFFLVVGIMPLFFLGFIMEYFQEKLSAKHFKIVFALLILIVASFNVYEIGKRFKELYDVPRKPVHIESDKILLERYRITLGQQRMIVDRIEGAYEENGKTVFVGSLPFYYRSFNYLVDKRGVPRVNFDNKTAPKGPGNYFMVLPIDSEYKKALTKFEEFNVVSVEEFGTMLLFTLEPKFVAQEVADSKGDVDENHEIAVEKKEEVDNGNNESEEEVEEIEKDSNEEGEKNEKKDDSENSKPAVPKRYKWNEIF